MKINRIVCICFLIITGIVISNINSQTLSLNIKKSDTTEKNIPLSGLRKLTFTGTDLVVSYLAGNSENVSLSLINKMVFGPYTALVNTYDNADMAVYPNPTSDFISLKNVVAGSSVDIYSLSGIKLMSVVAGTEKIDVSKLSRGVYLLKSNSQVFKFSKL